jgi:hypothetical protein
LLNDAAKTKQPTSHNAMKSIIATLSPQTIETLITWCEADKYTEVRKRCAKPKSEGGLDLQISESTLNRLFSTHGIADSAEARQEYIALLNRGPNVNLLDVSYENLELRLFELSARPNPIPSDLRLIFQIVTRLRALKISERRVQIDEQRETRLAQTAATKAGGTSSHESPSSGPFYTEEDLEPKLTEEQRIYRTRVILGKTVDNEGNEIQPPQPSPQSLAAPKPPPETRLSAAEMQYRVRVMLGKEPPDEAFEEQMREKERIYQEWKQKMLKTRKPQEP